MAGRPSSLGSRGQDEDSFGQLANSPNPRADTFGTLLPGAPSPLPIKQLSHDAPEMPLPSRQPQLLLTPQRHVAPRQRSESMDFGVFGRLPSSPPLNR